MKGSTLDLYLSKGYFRMQQDLFTCRFVMFDHTFSPVHWLRIDLSQAYLGKKQLALLRIREKFSITIRPFVLTDEVNQLYAHYRRSIDFDAPDTIASSLYTDFSQDAFNTYAVEIRDRGLLIAVGIFDMGQRTIAGIMNFYHPAYRKYSLGKCLMLLKMEFARMQRMAYYYPGYIASDYPKLNYKLFACEAATEVYDDYSDMWYPFSWETVSALMDGRSDAY